MRCGLDSDCNPASACGILATSLGYSKIPSKFTKRLEFCEGKHKLELKLANTKTGFPEFAGYIRVF